MTNLLCQVLNQLFYQLFFSIALLTRQTLSFNIDADGLPSARHKRVVPLGTRIEIFSIRLSIINMAAFLGGLCCGILNTHPQDRFERDAPLVWVPYPEGLFYCTKKGRTNRPSLADSSPATTTSGRVQNAFNRRLTFCAGRYIGVNPAHVIYFTTNLPDYS